jgi:hypothetical protein
LELPLARDFIKSILEILETQAPSNFENAVKKAHKQLMNKKQA